METLILDLGRVRVAIVDEHPENMEHEPMFKIEFRSGDNVSKTITLSVYEWFDLAIGFKTFHAWIDAKHEFEPRFDQGAMQGMAMALTAAMAERGR